MNTLFIILISSFISILLFIIYVLHKIKIDDELKIEEVIERLLPFIQQLDMGSRNEKWIAEAFGKDGIHYSSGRKETLIDAIIALESKVRKFNIL